MILGCAVAHMDHPLGPPLRLGRAQKTHEETRALKL
jgi:hypothetical protein